MDNTCAGHALQEGGGLTEVPQGKGLRKNDGRDLACLDAANRSGKGNARECYGTIA
jgi:hypothetical protein